MADLRVTFKAFDSKMASREKLFRAAAEYASQIGPDRLITMSHSEDRDNIVITIWYWTDEPEGTEVKAKFQGGWKKPELKSTGEKIVPTKAATTGAPVARPPSEGEKVASVIARADPNQPGDPVRPPAAKTMQMPLNEVPPEESGADE
jgi:hypothetical protein